MTSYLHIRWCAEMAKLTADEKQRRYHERWGRGPYTEAGISGEGKIHEEAEKNIW